VGETAIEAQAALETQPTGATDATDVDAIAVAEAPLEGPEQTPGLASPAEDQAEVDRSSFASQPGVDSQSSPDAPFAADVDLGSLRL
jgi:hypothetical protein